MSVICSCKVKTEISTELTEPTFGKIIEKTFKDSNFGVVRCYNLVINLKNKLNNYGFLIYLLLIIAHLICFIYYFIKGIKPISIFVFREMEKYHYIAKIHNPKKKKSIKNKFQNRR